MELEQTRKWMEEIRTQCRFSSYAWQQMRHSLIGMDKAKSFFYVHAFLNHAMEISRILWPETEDNNDRGEELCRQLSLETESLLNHGSLKHIVARFDERMELWMKTLDTPQFLNMNIMPIGTMAGAREDLFVRSLDPETYRLEILDHRFELRELNEALRKMDQRVERWLNKHSY